LYLIRIELRISKHVYGSVGNAVGLEDAGGDERSLVSEEGLAALVMLRKEAGGHSLEASTVLGSDCVPALGLPKVQVVDAVEVHVLRVPRKGGFPHAEVQVGGVHSFNGDFVVFADVIEDRAQLVDVPLLRK
jgi:hypothetical protein